MLRTLCVVVLALVTWVNQVQAQTMLETVSFILTNMTDSPDITIADEKNCVVKRSGVSGSYYDANGTLQFVVADKVFYFNNVDLGSVKAELKNNPRMRSHGFRTSWIELHFSGQKAVSVWNAPRPQERTSELLTPDDGQRALKAFEYLYARFCKGVRGAF